MASIEKIVSPGVFTNEKDSSFLPSGIAAIGAAIIGPTPQGRAFVPTIVQNFDEFIALYGGLSEETYVPYAVESYLKAAGTVTVIRVLPDGGYNTDPVHIIHSSSLGFKLVGAILPTTTIGSSTGKGFTASDFSVFNGKSVTGSFGFQLSGSDVAAQILTASANPTSPDSFANVLSKSVKGAKRGYMYTWFSDYLGTQTGLSGSVSFRSASAETFFNLSGSAGTAGAWRPAYTPWIQTQKIGGDFQDLFRFATLADGTDTNTSVKISVINTVLPGVNPGSPYGSFTVVVRGYSDTDKRQNILETFSNVNLDPDSVDYIARRIGDRTFTVASTGLVKLTGDYNNSSKYVRVEVAAEVASKTITTLAKPFGFRAFYQTVSSSFTLPTASYITATPEIDGFYNRRANYGWNFSSTDNGNYNKPIPGGASVGNNVAFNLDNCFVHPSASKGNDASSFVGGQSISGSTFAGLDVANFLKFNIAFQDGFDGMDPAVPKKVGGDIEPSNVFGLNCTNVSSEGSKAYIKALNTISNGDEYDVNLLAMPGINADNHLSVATKAIEVAEERGDAFVIMDPVKYGKSINEVISAVQISNIQSNYVAMYWPWVKITDRNRNKPVWVPPSVVLPRVYANNDTVAYEWFAPAGLNRGGIRDAVDVESKLGQAERNDLYENRINPLASFPAQGICVWGQKTMQATPSALDRVNVRRLLITLKKYIASTARYLVFENNTAVTRQRFINLITPYLETVKSRQGLFAFKVVMDETNNTPDIVDRNILYGQIYLQPAKAAEFVILDFNVLRTGATFQNA